MFSNMDEQTARFTFNAACGLSAFAAAASIMLGVRESQIQALIFLVFAVVLCWVCLSAYARYKQLRDTRWKTELKKSEDELNQLLNHARMTILCEHSVDHPDDQCSQTRIAS